MGGHERSLLYMALIGIQVNSGEGGHERSLLYTALIGIQVNRGGT